MPDANQPCAHMQERSGYDPQEAQSSGITADTESEVLMSVKHAQRREVTMASSAQENLASDGE